MFLLTYAHFPLLVLRKLCHLYLVPVVSCVSVYASCKGQELRLLFTLSPSANPTLSFLKDGTDHSRAAGEERATLRWPLWHWLVNISERGVPVLT